MTTSRSATLLHGPDDRPSTAQVMPRELGRVDEPGRAGRSVVYNCASGTAKMENGNRGSGVLLEPCVFVQKQMFPRRARAGDGRDVKRAACA